MKWIARATAQTPVKIRLTCPLFQSGQQRVRHLKIIWKGGLRDSIPGSMMSSFGQARLKREGYFGASIEPAVTERGKAGGRTRQACRGHRRAVAHLHELETT